MITKPQSELPEGREGWCMKASKHYVLRHGVKLEIKATIVKGFQNLGHLNSFEFEDLSPIACDIECISQAIGLWVEIRTHNNKTLRLDEISLISFKGNSIDCQIDFSKNMSSNVTPYALPVVKKSAFECLSYFLSLDKLPMSLKNPFTFLMITYRPSFFSTADYVIHFDDDIIMIPMCVAVKYSNNRA